MSTTLTSEEQQKADALAKAVIGELARGTKQEVIVKQLTSKGMNQDVAANYVNNLAQRLDEYKRSPQGRGTLASKYQGRMIRGGLICLVGIIITVATMAMASNGGRYVLAWGAIIFGGFDFVAGLVGWLKNS